MNDIESAYEDGFDRGLYVGYLAAIIDGEGSIAITRSRAHGGRKVSYTPCVSVSNTSLELLSYVWELVGYGHINAIGGKPRKQVCYGLYIRPLSVILRLLEEVRPYLKAKKKRCDLLIEFCKSRLERLRRSHQSPYSKREIEIFWEVRELNKKRGKG